MKHRLKTKCNPYATHSKWVQEINYSSWIAFRFSNKHLLFVSLLVPNMVCKYSLTRVEGSSQDRYHIWRSEIWHHMYSTIYWGIKSFMSRSQNHALAVYLLCYKQYCVLMGRVISWVYSIMVTFIYAGVVIKLLIFTPQPSELEGYCRHGPSGRAGGCQTCGTHISVTARWIFSIRSSVELSRPVVVHRHGHLPICPTSACPWTKNLSNLAQIGSRLCGTHISETAGWIDPMQSFMDLSGPVVVHCYSYLPICPIWACPWAKNLSNQAALGPDFAEPISVKPLDGSVPFEVLWKCLDL